MSKKEELQKKLKKLGYQIFGDESVADMEAELKGLDENADEKSGSDSKGTGGKVYLWLKTRAYIDDEKRINPGLYCMAEGEMYPRLEKASAAVCEIFEEEIPSRSLVKIARSCGVDPDNYDDDEDLLNVLLIKDVQTF